MIFWVGFIIMFLNEGFVMMRHVSPFFAEQRDKLIERFGEGWQYFHGLLDYLWVIVVVLGFIFSPHRVAHLVVFTAFWSAALFGIYVPMWVKNNAKPL